MRILFVTDSYIPVPSGVTVAVETLRISLGKLGHEALIVAPKYPGWQTKERGVARLPGFFRPFEKYRPSFWPTIALNKSKLRDFKIDLIHSHYNFSYFDYPIELARYLNVPLVNTAYRVLGDNARENAVWLKSLISFANAADLNIALSRAAKKYLGELNIHSPIETLPVGIFPKDFSSYPPEAIRKKFNIPANRKIVLYVGSLNRDAELQFIVKSFKKVWRALEDDVHLLIIGGGRYYKKYKSAIAASSLRKYVSFAGFLPKSQTNKIYAVADVLIHCDPLDSEPLVILESLAAGTSVVAIKGFGAQEFVKNNEDGFISAHDPDEFSQKIIDLLKRDRLRLDFSLKARIDARRFRASILTQELLDLYRNSIENFKNKLI